MMTPKNIKAKTAIEYFKKGYYEQGKWLRQGAEKLELKGEIKDFKVYENIVKGLSPDGSKRLNQRGVDEDKRKAAVDCTFEAPKSVSITALLGGDERLIEAHNQAVEEVLQLMEERYAQTRIMVDGKTQDVIRTRNLIVAKHDHIESRKLDPHIHSHCLVMNATQAPNQEWYSHLNDAIFKNQKLLGMMYQHRLAAKAEKLGYEVEWKDNGQFDIKGYSEKDLMDFSKRRKQILAVARAEASWAERERAWKKTRTNKEYVPPDELKARWREEAKALGIEIVKPGEPRPELEPAQISQKLFDDAIKHCSERRVAFKVEDIEKFILSHSYHTVNVPDLQSLNDSSAELIRLEEKNGVRYTTQKAVQLELATIRLMQEGQRTVASITHPEIIEHYLEEIRLKQDRKLNQGQRQAVMITLTTNDQIVAWQGVAGAGKTFALEQVKALAEEQGYMVKGLAPSARAARVLAKDIKSETQTVAQLLCSRLPKEVQPNQIWVVDEAGLLSTKEAHALLRRAAAEQARVILVGDTKQLSAVEAGNPFKSLQQRGMKTAYLNESQRQKDPNLKLAVDLLADGCIENGFNKLLADGRIKTVDAATLVDEIVQAYVKLTPEERRQTLLLAGTNVQRRIVNAALRKVLKAEGSLGDDVTLTQLKAKDLSDTEKQGYLSHFAVGDVVIPLRDYKRKGLVKGERYEVAGKTIDKLQLKAADGTQLAVSLDFKKAVFEREQIQIAVGDRLMWKKNNYSQEQVNGEEVLVKAIDGNQVEIEAQNGKTRTIDLSQPHHLEHALVRTTYSSQGETADRVLVAADSTIGQESFYVAASRARHELCFFTQNTKELLRWALESRAQENALDLLRQQLEKQMQLEVTARASQPSASTVVVEKPHPQQNSPISAASGEAESTVAPPIKRTNITPKPIVAAPIKRETQPSQPEPASHHPITQTPVKRSTIEAFWTPSCAGEAPTHIEPKHWKELVEGSAIHPDLAESNVESVAGRGVYERLLSTKLEKIGGSGQYVTKPAAKLMQAYEQVAEGGWWAQAGVDARSLPQIQPGDQPEYKSWGSFKPDHPRVDADKSQRKGKTEFIKYEHPPAEERQLFLFKVPATLAEQIYSKHKLQPTETEKQSGFWHVVHKYNLPITVTEGAKKTLSSLSQGEVTIGLSGVNGGYASRDRDKARLKQRLLHPELKAFATPGREFRFAFDQDTKLSTIFNVRRELVRTGELLEQEGCKVRVVQWQGDKGLDDLIVNQGPHAYAQAHSNSIPFDWEAKKHYRNEYTRLAKQVRNSQPALSAEAVDLEVYKAAVLKGDIRDGGRVIAQSDQSRAFKTELPPQEVHARTLDYTQHIEQQIYASVARTTESRQSVVEKVTNQHAPISVAPPLELSTYLNTQQQEISHDGANSEQSQTIDNTGNGHNPARTRGAESQPQQPAAGSGAVENQRGQSPSGAGRLSNSTDGKVEFQEIQQLSRGDAEVNHGFAEYQSGFTGTEKLTAAVGQHDSKIAGDVRKQTTGQLVDAIADYIQQSALVESVPVTQALKELTAHLTQLQAANTTRTIEQLSSTISGNLQENEGAEGAGERGRGLTLSLPRSPAPPHPCLFSPPLREVGSQPYQFAIAPEELAQAISKVSEQEALGQLTEVVAEFNHALADRQPLTVGVENLIAAVEQLHTEVRADIRQQVTRKLSEAITDYVEQSSVGSQPIVQALQGLTEELEQFQSAQTTKAIELLNTTISEHLPAIQAPDTRSSPNSFIQSPADRPISTRSAHHSQSSQLIDDVDLPKVAQQGLSHSSAQPEELVVQPYRFKIKAEELAQAISDTVEQEALGQTTDAIALLNQSLAERQPSTLNVENLTTAVEQLRAAVTADIKRQQVEKLADAITDYAEQSAVQSESTIQALKELSQNLGELKPATRAKVLEQLNTLLSSYTFSDTVSRESSQQQGENLKEPAAQVELQPVSENTTNHQSAILPITDGREWVRIKTERPELQQYNNQIGVVVGRIRVAGSEQVKVQIGKYTPGFDSSELEPINSVAKQESVRQYQPQAPQRAKLSPQQLWQEYSQRTKSPNPVSKQLEVARLAWSEGVPETQIRQILQANPYLQQFGEKGVRELVELPLRKVKAEAELSKQSQRQTQKNNQQRRQKEGPQM